MKSEIIHSSRLIFTGDNFQLEIEKERDSNKVRYFVRENVGAEPGNPLFKTRISGDSTFEELQSVQNSLKNFVNGTPAN